MQTINLSGLLIAYFIVSALLRSNEIWYQYRKLSMQKYYIQNFVTIVTFQWCFKYVAYQNCLKGIFSNCFITLFYDSTYMYFILFILLTLAENCTFSIHVENKNHLDTYKGCYSQWQNIHFENAHKNSYNILKKNGCLEYHQLLERIYFLHSSSSNTLFLDTHNSLISWTS